MGLFGSVLGGKNSDRIGKGVVLATDVANHQEIHHQGAQKAYEHIPHGIPHAGAVDVLQVSSDDGGGNIFSQLEQSGNRHGGEEYEEAAGGGVGALFAVAALQHLIKCQSQNSHKNPGQAVNYLVIAGKEHIKSGGASQ